MLAGQVEVAAALSELDNVVAVAPIAVSDDSSSLAFQVVPAEGPNSESTDALVQRPPRPAAGRRRHRARRRRPGRDQHRHLREPRRSAAALPAVVVGLSLLIMILVFRSLLVPIIATGGFILSLFATYGPDVAVFQWGWGADVLGMHSTGPILSFLPVILVGILFGLAMDYQLFLASGMREAYVHGSPARSRSPRASAPAAPW